MLTPVARALWNGLSERNLKASLQQLHQEASQHSNKKKLRWTHFVKHLKRTFSTFNSFTLGLEEKEKK